MRGWWTFASRTTNHTGARLASAKAIADGPDNLFYEPPLSGAILMESGLSFLGIGVPAEAITWGSLLAGARSNASAWWLVVVPGTAIFTTVTMYNLLGDGLRDALDPKMKAG